MLEMRVARLHSLGAKRSGLTMALAVERESWYGRAVVRAVRIFHICVLAVLSRLLL